MDQTKKTAQTTRTELKGLDTNGDTTDDVLFSVTPKLIQEFHHPGAVTYLVQVENLRTDVALRILKKRADINGNEEYEFLDKSVGVGERVTIESVTLAHSTPSHLGQPVLLAQTLKYRVAIGDARFPTSFDLRANCNDMAAEKPQGASVDPPRQDQFILRDDARVELLACAKRLVELLG